MLSARLPTFRHVSRTGDKAMALHDPAERLQRGVCTTLKVQLRNTECDAETLEDTAPLWQEGRDTPETELLRELDAATIRRLVAALPTKLREAIVLREINDVSSREIAELIGAPVGTVMSRLARA